jgi:hypothetical protein
MIMDLGMTLVCAEYGYSKGSPNKQKTNKLRGLSPQANYTDRATDACRRS